jgi:hypothetical protein
MIFKIIVIGQDIDLLFSLIKATATATATATTNNHKP